MIYCIYIPLCVLQDTFKMVKMQACVLVTILKWIVLPSSISHLRSIFKLATQYVLLEQKSNYFIVSRLEGPTKVTYCLDCWLAIKFDYITNKWIFNQKDQKSRVRESLNIGEECREQKQLTSREHRKPQVYKYKEERGRGRCFSQTAKALPQVALVKMKVEK